MRDEILNLLDRMEDADPFESERLAKQISKLVRESTAADARRFRYLHSFLTHAALVPGGNLTYFASMSLDDLREWCDRDNGLRNRSILAEEKAAAPAPSCECDPSMGCGKPPAEASSQTPFENH